MVGRIAATGCLIGVLATAGFGQRALRIRVEPPLAPVIRAISLEFQKTRKDVNCSFVLGRDADVVLGAMVPVQSNRLFALNRAVVVVPTGAGRITKFAHIGLNIKLAVPNDRTMEGRRASAMLEQARASYGGDWWLNVKRNWTIHPASPLDAAKLVMEGKADAAVRSEERRVGKEC